MAGEDEGHAALGVLPAQEFADALLGGRVQAYRWLVEEDYVGLVEHRGDELHPHALAEREGAHGRAEEMFDLEGLGEAGEAPTIPVLRDAVDRLVEEEGVARGEVPPELALLAHHEGHAREEGLGPIARPLAQDPELARAGPHDPREQLHQGGLARSVGPDDAEHLAAAQLEVEVYQGGEGLDALVKKGTETTGKAFGLDRLLVGPREFGGEEYACVVHVASREPELGSPRESPERCRDCAAVKP